MTQSFKVGDKVQLTPGARYTGEIVFGPFDTAFGTDRFMVKRDDGIHLSVPAYDLVPKAPVYTVGTTVVSNSGSGRAYKLVAGPFTNAYGSTFWVGEINGAHAVCMERNFAGPAAGPVHGYTHDGVVYDMAAQYRDREGDVWSFTGRRNEIGEPYVTMLGNMGNLSDTIVSIANVYGPLVLLT